MDKNIQQFIEENIALIQNQNWEEIYKKRFPNGFTKAILDCGINPLKQGLDYIPANFLSGANIQKFEISDNVTSIGYGAFFYCSSLTEIVIPEGVNSIGATAFSSCSSLKEIEIPSSVASIGSYAFSFCSSLTKIVIPKSVTSIDYRAFAWCNSLTIYCEAESKPSGWDKDWNHSDCPVVWGYTGE